MGPGVHVPSPSIGRGHPAARKRMGRAGSPPPAPGTVDCSFPAPMKWPLSHRERSKSHPSHSRMQGLKSGRASPSMPAGPEGDAGSAGTVLCHQLLSQGALGEAGWIPTYETRPNPAAAF